MKILIKESQYNFLVEQTTPITSGGTTTVLTPQQQRLKQIELNKEKAEALRQERAKAFAVKDSLKKERNKIVWAKSYEKNKKPGQTFDQWYKEFDDLTKKNSAEAPEPKGERTFFAGDNGPKSPCKGGKCPGLN